MAIAQYRLYPVTAIDVINNDDRQSIDIFGIARRYYPLNDNQTGAQSTIIKIAGKRITVSGTLFENSLEVGYVINSTDDASKIGRVIGSVQASNGFITSIVVDSVEGLSVGDAVYYSIDEHVDKTSLIAVRDRIGQIDENFDFDDELYYEYQINIFGDVKASTNTYKNLSAMVSPYIEVIVGEEELGTWRTERNNGITVIVTSNEITLVGDWSSKLPEQLLWNIRASIKEHNETNPQDQFTISEYYGVSGKLVIYKKTITDLSGFYASSDKVYDKFEYIEEDAALLDTDIGLMAQTVTKFTLEIRDVEVGDKIGFLTGDVSEYKILVEADVDILKSTVLTLIRGSDYKIRVRRHGYIEPLYNVNEEIRVLSVQFVQIKNYVYRNTFQGDLATIFEWDDVDSIIRIIMDIDLGKQETLDMFDDYNMEYPQGIDAEPLVNGEDGYDQDILSLNYQLESKSVEHEQTIQVAAEYRPLALIARESNGSKKYNYIKLTGTTVNGEHVTISWEGDKSKLPYTDGSDIIFNGANGDLITLLIAEYGHDVLTVINKSPVSGRLAYGGGTHHIDFGLPEVPNGEDRGVYHLVRAAQVKTQKYTIYPVIRLGAQIRKKNDDGSYSEVDGHIAWGTNPSVSIAFDGVKEKIDTIDMTTKEIKSEASVNDNEIRTILSDIEDQTSEITEGEESVVNVLTGLAGAIRNVVGVKIEELVKSYKGKSVYFDDLLGTQQVKQNKAKAVWTYEDDGVTVFRKVKFLDAQGVNAILSDATAIEEYT